MKLSKLLMKIFLTIVSLCIIASVASADMAPNIPFQMVLIYVFIGVSALLVLLILVSIIFLTFGQFILRKGGIDTQWLWFYNEPNDLVKSRDAISEVK